MTPDRASLLARILAFDIDGGDAALPFAARLARENGWTRHHADRVVTEYKRFVFLAASGTQPVCPSEDVDAAWHLHLTYTRSYWKRLCGEVLGRPLHHDPTRGGPAEGAKHVAMYAHTFAVYREAFGHEPPADIWPAAERRFGDDTRHRAVNTSRNWVVPKAPVKRAAALVCGFAVAAVLVPGCDGGLNPFALKNNDFLLLLFVSLVTAVIVGRVLLARARKPDPQPGDDAVELDWEQLAYLAGGAPRLTSAAIARLVGRGMAKVDADGKTLAPGGDPPDDATAVERAARQALPMSNEPADLARVQEAVEDAFEPRAEQLAADGLLLSPGDQTRARMAAFAPVFVVLLVLALPRHLMGFFGGHPTGYLTLMIVGGGAISLLLALAGSVRLSNRGRGLVAGHLSKHAALRTGTLWESGRDAGMAVALFGTAVLAGTVVAPLQAWYPRQTAEASSSGCGGSGCGTSDSDSGGGDGGGCGGGCGGGGD